MKPSHTALLEVLARLGPSDVARLHHSTRYAPKTIRYRLPELERAGLACRAGRTATGRPGQPPIRWAITQPGRAALRTALWRRRRDPADES